MLFELNHSEHNLCSDINERENDGNENTIENDQNILCKNCFQHKNINDVNENYGIIKEILNQKK